MVFIVGGAYQGKLQYAMEHYPDCTIINSYHKKVREQVNNNQDSILLAKEFLDGCCKEQGNLDNLVVVNDELGYGVVPMDKSDRALREANGRVNCLFAKEATEVIRVVCGVGNKIK